jgi:hypothetical protein
MGLDGSSIGKFRPVKPTRPCLQSIALTLPLRAMPPRFTKSIWLAFRHKNRRRSKLRLLRKISRLPLPVVTSITTATAIKLSFSFTSKGDKAFPKGILANRPMHSDAVLDRVVQRGRCSYAAGRESGVHRFLVIPVNRFRDDGARISPKQLGIVDGPEMVWPNSR